MNQIKNNPRAIPTGMALAANGAYFVAAYKNVGLTLNVIVPLLIHIALSIGSDSPIVYSEMY